MTKIRVNGKIDGEDFTITAEQDNGDEFAEVKIECDNAEFRSMIEDNINTGKNDIGAVCLHNYMDEYIPFFPDPDGIDGIYEILVYYYGKSKVEVEGDPYFKIHKEMEEDMEKSSGVIVY